ncbi:iron chelate uptake ABC transporter family permease subunit [Marinomonas sp.]|nr:iron chelate uptake ABC transporter family permease subunit [Marinomonas sp.]MDB4836954.1 iron chelate uptake ABC transporter family permease subunit [Marinomonas sp.]
MPRRAFLIIIIIWLVASLSFLLLGSEGDLNFVWRFRFEKWLALNLVGLSVALATFLFQIVSQSRVLTPAIMGLDSVFLLFNILLIGLWGGVEYAALSSSVKFFMQVFCMMFFAVAVFGLLVRRFSMDINRLLLIGIALGLLIQSLVEFFARLITPEDFSLFQGIAFAQFNRIQTELLGVVAGVIVFVLIVLWRIYPALDIYRLGRNSAINLGIPYTKMTTNLLMLVAMLVSVSTALVGPIFFFGLLIIAIVFALFPSARSGPFMIMSAFVGATSLVGGQAIFEHLLGLASTLSVVIEFVGGLIFFMLLLKSGKKD